MVKRKVTEILEKKGVKTVSVIEFSEHDDEILCTTMIGSFLTS